MQRINITTSLSSQMSEPMYSHNRPVIQLRTVWTITFEFRYHNAQGDVALERTLEYRLETQEGWPFSERELSRFRVAIRRGPHNDRVGILDSRTGPFRFDEDYEVHIDDAGHIATFFDGIFDITDFPTPPQAQKQLNDGKKALPAGRGQSAG